MEEPRFGDLLKQYRSKTVDPQTGRPFSRDNLADALQDNTGIIGMRHKLRTWEDNQGVPEDGNLVGALARLLAQHQAISDPSQIESLYRTAGFTVPAADELSKILPDPASAAKQTLNSSAESPSYRGVNQDMRQMVSERPSPSQVNPPEITDKAEIIHNNLHIQVLQTGQGWLLPVEALVIVPFAEFYNALESSLPYPNAGAQLRKILEISLKEGLTYTQPVVVELDESLGRVVLPNAPGGRARIVMAIARDSRDEVRLENIRPMMKALLDACSRFSIGSVAMPLIGTGGSKGRHLEVLGEILNELLETTPKPPLEQVAIVTLLPEVVAAAHQRFNPTLEVHDVSVTPVAGEVQISTSEVLARSQKLFNDRPEGEDQLGIRDEVNALADTLMLQDIEPPLSVAVMGGWGSGKSFVLKLIRDRMAEIRTWPTQAKWDGYKPVTQGTDFVGHVYQIEFNAWTYAKSNLWASLMQTLFVELNRQLSLEKLLKDVLQKDDSPYYRLLYVGGIQPDNNLLALLKKDPDLQEMIREEARPDNQILWDRLRERKKKNVKDLAETEQRLADAKAALNQALRQSHEQASDVIGQQDRVAGIFAVKDLIKKTASSTLSEQLEQVISYKDFDEAKISLIRQVIAQKSLSIEKKRQLREMGVDKIHIQKLLAAKNLDNAGIRQILEVDEEQVKETLETLKGSKETFLRILRVIRKNWIWSVIFVALFFIVWIFLPGLLRDLFARFSQSYPGLIELIRYIAALIPVTMPIVKEAQKWNGQVNTILDEYEAALERGKADWQARQEAWLDKRRTQEMKSISTILADPLKSQQEKQQELEKQAAAGSLAAQETLVEMLQAQAEEQRRLVGPIAKFTSLLEFVRSRLDAKDYESQLGLMHQVKLDIDELTNSLSIQNWDDPETIKAKQQFFPRGPARVVLFIDDLDRCPPPRVVEVLEAVQLLLITNLFVVVLGLDTRYITLALEKEYKEILRHEGDPSGLDYIEKIIQIPYGVRPIEKDEIRNFLMPQMEIEAASVPAESPGIPAPAQPGQTPPMSGTNGSKEKAGDTASGGEGSVEKPGETPPGELVEPQSTDTQATWQALQEIKAKPHLPSEREQRQVKFLQEDLDDLELCGRLVSLTPRSLRRLVNVLKLAKVYWSRSAAGEPSRHVKQTVIAILAVSAAYPEIMREAFVQIDISYRKKRGVKKVTFINLFKDLRWQKTIEETFAWQLGRFRADIQRLGDEGFCCVSLDELGQTNFDLVRSFSFVGDPSYWSNRVERTPSRTTARKVSGAEAQEAT